MTIACAHRTDRSPSNDAPGGAVAPRRAMPRHRRRRYLTAGRWGLLFRVCRFPRPVDAFAPGGTECRRCGGALTWVRAYHDRDGFVVPGRWRHLLRRRRGIVIGSESVR